LNFLITKIENTKVDEIDKNKFYPIELKIENIFLKE